MIKKIVVFTIILALAYTAKCQTDCEAKFNAEDVLSWRRKLKFTPTYMTIEKLEYVINRLSENDYNQIHIEVSVYCDSKKETLVDNMVYFWNYKISKQDISRYFPAYYFFYQMDKVAYLALRTKGN